MKKLFTYVLMLCASLSVSVAQQIQYPADLEPGELYEYHGR